MPLTKQLHTIFITLTSGKKMITIGTRAPNFILHSSPDEKIRLSDLSGKNVILAFYPADWSPVCGDQMALYNEMLTYFEHLNAQLLGISVDSRWCHASYCADRKLQFPLLADFEPKGMVSSMYHVYDKNTGESMRALYVIDHNGIIRWNYLSPINENPGADGILDALEEIEEQKKKL